MMTNMRNAYTRCVLFIAALILASSLPAAAQGTPSSQERCRQSVLVGPAAPQPLSNHRSRESQLGFPLLDGLRATVQREQTVDASVAVLLAARGPSAVTRLVTLSVLNSIEARSDWALAHMSEERFEVVDPFGAHRDTAVNVVLSGLAIRRGATSLRFMPRAVRARPRQAVRCIPLAQNFFNRAAAAARTELQAARRDDGLVAAHTATDPSTLAVESRFLRRRANDFEVTE